MPKISILFFIMICALLLIFYVWMGNWRLFEKKENAGQIYPQNETISIKHLACIMDGNRRWAKKEGMIPWHGHKEGMQAVKTIVEFCLEHRISYLSLYTFSLENFKRTQEENKFLFSLMVNEASKKLEEFKKYGIKARFIGDRSLFPQEVIAVVDKVERETAQNAQLTINFLFCYGGQQELVAGVKKIAQQAKNNEIAVDAINKETLQKSLWLGDIPEPEIIIRTGGFKRLSNFLLFQSAYSEIYFLDCLWPDIKKQNLELVLAEFSQTKRNFGT